MKKKLFGILLALVLCFGLAATAFAWEGFTGEYYRVLDMADLLTDREEAALLKTLDAISLRQKVDVVVATTDSLDGKSVVAYADDLYDGCRFGYGSNQDGLLLLISMEDRDWYISTCGFGITAFTDAGIDYIGRQIQDDLSDGEFAAAFDSFARLCDDFITQAKNGDPYDHDNLPREPLSVIWIAISLFTGLVIALIVVGTMKGALKTVRPQGTAGSYIKHGSMNVTQCRDLFLYRNVVRTPRPKNNTSSGSSTHRSSSGNIHGGGGGKF